MRQRSIAVVLATAVAILGGVLVPLQYAQVVCCASPRSPSQLTQGGQTATAAANTTEVALLLYYFQVNGTTGSLFVVLQNIGRLNTSVSSVYFDDSLFNSSFVMPSEACGTFVIGSECRMTLAFGLGSLLPPPMASTHSFSVETTGGDRFEYSVVAGEGRANCGLAYC
jgi:hypothetical protein